MITTTLLANGASVYIIGPKQDGLDRSVDSLLSRRYELTVYRIAQIYNDAAAKANKPGRIIGIQGDVRQKVRWGREVRSHQVSPAHSQSEALRLAEEIGKREKHITVLFNNAG